MISETIQKALNKQINIEFSSSYLYLSMSSYFKSIHWNGFANWAKQQSVEEQEHGMKFYNYVLERGGELELLPIEAPPTKWESPLAAFEAAFSSEKKVTGMINDLMNMSIDEKDHATTIFLQWFVTEQIEEEGMTDDIVQRLKLIDNSVNGLILLDNELGKRA